MKKNPHGYKTKILVSLRSHHNILLPIIVAPGYVARNILGARLVVWAISILSIFALLLYLKYHSFSSASSKLISSLFILQLPIITYSQYVYTDLISGYLMLWGTLPLLSYLKNQVIGNYLYLPQFLVWHHSYT
ncbi:hypothetical protein HC766_05735 [Candidatus Gracilibacteria bacterium]|nr:hypothetical protein [Candidatus Gracilibacteria bacterium]